MIVPYEHYIIIFEDDAGRIQFAASSSLYKQTENVYMGLLVDDMENAIRSAQSRERLKVKSK